MSGYYYEWQDTAGGKQPWYFTARDDSPALTVAGLWDEWKNRETGERLKSCTMIITEPNTIVADIHDRMPALLSEKDFEPWLGGEASVELLTPRLTICCSGGRCRNASTVRRRPLTIPP